MTVRRLLSVLGLLAVLLCAGGCGGGNTVTPDETTDPVYQQAQDWKKQGRNGEALSAFLRVIDHRGESGAPQSHLEAGALYLNYANNPVEAYHHFSRYLELEPNGKEAEFVRGQRDAAMREIAHMLRAPSSDGGAGAQTSSDDVEDLRRQIRDLKAENDALRGNASAPVMHSAPIIALPDTGSSVAASAPAPESPITPAPRPPPAADEASFTRALANAPQRPLATMPAPARGSERSVATPSRSGAPGSRTPATTAGHRTHVVAQHDSLWGIARRYYGSNVNATQVHGIYEANREVMTSPTDLRIGMVLRIP